jgi:hypothetical protein
MKIVAAQNGLGPEDFIAAELGAADVWRMSLNLGAALTAPAVVETAFFNKPNHLFLNDIELGRTEEARAHSIKSNY